MSRAMDCINNVIVPSMDATTAATPLGPWRETSTGFEPSPAMIGIKDAWLLGQP